MARQSLTLPEVAEKLGVHYMTAYRYVRTGRLPAKRSGNLWRIDPLDLEQVRRSDGGTGQRRMTGVVPTRAQLEARLVASDEPGAWDVVEIALGSGMEPDAVLLELLVPVLRTIGTLWEQGELSIADEHRASVVAMRLISRLGARFGRRGHKRGTVIIAAPSGEQHALPVAIAANLLRWQGFAVIELGVNTPAEAVAEAAADEPGLVAVAISCTTRASCQAARRTVAALRARSPQVPVLLGGAAIKDQAHARRLGADVFTSGRADELVSAVEAIVVNKR